MKIYIDCDERYPDYYFYAESDDNFDLWYSKKPCIDVSTDDIHRWQHVSALYSAMQNELEELSKKAEYNGLCEQQEQLKRSPEYQQYVKDHLLKELESQKYAASLT